jgi:hypothetical protein
VQVAATNFFHLGDNPHHFIITHAREKVRNNWTWNDKHIKEKEF